MLPAWRCLWCKPRPAPASVPRRGETDSAAVTVSDGAAVAHGSPASECAFAAPAAADLRCQFVAHLDPRLDGGHSCRGAAPRTAAPRDWSAAPAPARARGASRAEALQPTEGGDARRSGRHGGAQRAAAPVSDGLRAPREAARAAARPQPPRLRQLDERRYRALGRVRIHSRKVGAPLDSRSSVGWEWRRGPRAARAWPPGRRSSPRRRRRAP